MDYQNIQTICPFCGCGCALNLEVIDGEIVGVLPANDHPVGRGSLCIKGWNDSRYDSWEEAGALNLYQRCNAEATRILSEHQVESTPGEILREIDRILQTTK